MCYRLVPGLLAEQTIEYDDVHQKLLVGLYLVPLSPTQYRLVMALLRQRQRWKESREQVPLFVSVRELMQVARVTKPASIKEHLCRASERLTPYQIVIGCLYGWGYGVFSSEEVPALVAPSPSLVLASVDSGSRPTVPGLFQEWDSSITTTAESVASSPILPARLPRSD